jgi:hypothetical protein
MREIYFVKVINIDMILTPMQSTHGS